jgi:hypothetical protein
MTARQSRWWQEISEFDIKLEHVPGSKLIQADALSRRPDHINEEEAKAKEIPQTMIPKDMVITYRRIEHFMVRSNNGITAK